MPIHHIYDIGSSIVVISSALYTFLPPWESFSDYPKFQISYKFLMLFIKGASGNFRSSVHSDIQATANKSGTDSK